MLQITNTKDENKGTKPNILTSAQGPFHPPFPSVSSPRYIPASFLSTTRTIFIFFWLDDLLYCIVFSREAEEKGHTLINLCLVTFYRSKISLKKCNRYLRKNNLIYFFNGAKFETAKLIFFLIVYVKFFILYCKSIANLFPFFDHFSRTVFMLD